MLSSYAVSADWLSLVHHVPQTFQDGIYIELVAFKSPPSAEHPWSSVPPGFLSYPFLNVSGADTTSPPLSSILNARSESFAYLPERSLSRTTLDDPPRTLHFILTVPHPKHGIHALPFFCGDLTPRAWRVRPRTH